MHPFNRFPAYTPHSSSGDPMRVLTWQSRGSYLYYLSQANIQFYLPVKPGRPAGYDGRSGGFPWGSNVHEVPAEAVKELKLDAVLYQSRRNYLHDRLKILSAEQQHLPALYLEHDPPCEHPTDTQHPVNDPNMLLVHVTHFNNLMWNSQKTPTTVIEHGVLPPPHVRYSGVKPRGIVVVNGLQQNGRRLGSDIFERARREVPLDLVGMKSKDMGGLGEVPLHELPAFIANYRFFFNPIRYTSLGLNVCEAMMIGMPIIGLASTELVTVVENGVSGYVDTDISGLIDAMQRLLADPLEALHLSEGARRMAVERFNIQRFARDWEAVFESVVGRRFGQPSPPSQLHYAGRSLDRSASQTFEPADPAGD